MNNEITIDIEEIRKLPDNSVTDCETIRQIALYCNRNPNDRELSWKIDRMFTYAGLYPEIMTSFNLSDKLNYFNIS